MDKKGELSAKGCISTFESPSRTIWLNPSSLASCKAEDAALASISNELCNWGNTFESEAITLPWMSRITTPILDLRSFVKIATSKFTLTISSGGARHRVRVVRGVHGSGWVGLKRYFDPIHHGGSKKIQPNPTHHISLIQPNPIYMGRVGSGWTHGFDKFLFLLLLNWVEKNYKY